MIVFSNITALGANVASGVASARIAIPVASSGEIPRYIRVVASINAHIRIGTVTTDALVTDTFLGAGQELYLMVPRGITHIAAIQDTVVGVVNVAPLEDC